MGVCCASTLLLLHYTKPPEEECKILFRVVFLCQYWAAQTAFNCSWNLSAMRAMNSELVGFQTMLSSRPRRSRVEGSSHRLAAMQRVSAQIPRLHFIPLGMTGASEIGDLRRF